MRLVRYGGKENGLMVIGSASELRRLGEALLSIPDEAPDLSSERWPPVVAEAFIEADQDYKLSFNLDTVAGDIPKSNFPRRWPFGWPPSDKK
jgi:hypothetical protein